MARAELQIPDAPPTGDIDFDAWIEKVVTHLQTYLGSFHDRGDPAAADFSVGDFTTDNTYNELDVSSIVPADANAVLLKVAIADGSISSLIQFRESGDTQDDNQMGVRTQVADLLIDGSIVVSMNSAQKIEYRGSNLTFTTLNVTIRGWWK